MSSTEWPGAPVRSNSALSAPGRHAVEHPAGAEPGELPRSEVTASLTSLGAQVALRSYTQRRRRSRRRRIALLVGLPLTLVLLLAGTGAAVLLHLQSVLDSRIERFGDPFASVPADQRPATDPATVPGTGTAGTAAAATPAKAMNLLVLGSDSRISAGDPKQWVAGAQRTDAIMLVHVPADRGHVYVTSIPRDSWVDIPGHGKAKINAAFSWGGPALTIRTVEKLTGVRIDHMVITDFTGFARITDLLGGVDISVAQTTTGNTHGQGPNFTAGTHHMDGKTALGYVRERYVLQNGDFDRVKRQQNWIRSVMHTAVAQGVPSDPRRIYDLIDAMVSSLSTDNSFSITAMRDLALSLRHTTTGTARFLTVPVTGTGTSADGQSIVLLDRAKDAELFAAAKHDAMEAFLASSHYPTLGSAVR